MEFICLCENQVLAPLMHAVENNNNKFDFGLVKNNNTKINK